MCEKNLFHMLDHNNYVIKHPFRRPLCGQMRALKVKFCLSQIYIGHCNYINFLINMYNFLSVIYKQINIFTTILYDNI